MVDERGGDAAGYLGWFFLGAVAGAAAALLLAPKSGTETRELLTEHSQEWFKKAQEVAEEAQGRAGDLFDKGREYVEEQRTTRRRRPRSHAQRTESTPRVRPSGAASHLDPF